MSRLLTIARVRPESRIAVLFCALLVWIAAAQPTILQNPAVVVQRGALYGIVAIGLTFLMLQGEIDLSVGSVIAGSQAVLSLVHGPLPVGIAVALLFGAGVGLLNAIVVVYLGLSSFIVTLGSLIAVQGLALLLLHSQAVPIAHADQAASFATTSLFSLNATSLGFLLLAAATATFLALTPAGREMYATGGNRDAARDAGIPVMRRLFQGFIFSGLAAAFAGVMGAMSTATADPTAGQDVLLIAVAAAILGGCSLAGGQGTVVGTTLGVLSIAGLQTLLDFSGAQSGTQLIVTGIVLFAVAVSDQEGLSQVRHKVVRSLHELTRPSAFIPTTSKRRK
jgi:ribose transport system permease protein